MHKPDAIAAQAVWPGEEDAAMDRMDEQEFQSLYDATARPILVYLAGVTGRRDVADDLLQETYCRFLVRRPPAMDAEGTRRYLFRIAANLLRDRWRRGEGAPYPEPGPLPGADAQVDLRIDVCSAMQALKPRERELLWLAYVEGMSHVEIAEAMGLRAMSVRLLLFRARRRAAGLLRPDEERA
jgi:RNA polymerase sigma-70 factor (ECF subfamily)